MNTITAPSAQLLGWLALALINQVLVVVLLPLAGGRLQALHHAYDVGQLLAPGAVSWAVATGAGLGAARLGWHFVQRRLWQAVLLGLTAFAVGLAILGRDVANFAERTGTSPALATAALAAACGLAMGSTRLFAAPRLAWWRVALALGGSALAVLNGLSLEADYFASHLMAAWLSALLIANAVEGLNIERLVARRQVALAAVCGLASALALVLTPGGDVRLRLYALPSSVLAPLLARFLPSDHVATNLVPNRYLTSLWFRKRDGLPDVPATRALSPKNPPIVMFFTVDAFRADLLESASQKKLPTFARLREASSYFSNAHAPTTSTLTTMASVFTGKYYTQLLWQRGKKGAPPLIEPTARFPQLLQRAGVRTMLFAGAQGRLHAHSGVPLGFDKDIVVSAEGKPASNNVAAIIEELDASARAPLFIYAHFIEPHAPYTLGGKEGSDFERYFREVALVNRELKRLRRYLSTKGLNENTYIIVSADHGEAFGEHSSFRHAKTVYEEQAHVPFFFYLPGREGRELSAPITLMDVGPTVLDLFGLPTPGHWMGQSLLPLVTGEKSTLERPVALDTGRRMQAFFDDDNYKVIFNRDQHTTEVYDLAADPKELINLATSGKPRVLPAIQTAELFFSRIRLKAPAEAAPSLEE